MNSIYIILLVVLLSPIFTVAADSDLSPYVSKLEDAAEVCDNSMFSTSECTKICTRSAEQFKQAKTFSGISGDAENAIMNCVTAMAANEDGRSSPLFNQVGALQATLSTELFKLNMASYGQQTLARAKATPAQTVTQQVIIDNNIYDASGQVDSNKIPALYDGLGQECQSQNGDMMKKLCRSMCQKQKTEVEKLLDIIKQAPKSLSAAEKERNTYNLLRTIETDLNLSCGNLYRPLPVAQQPKPYLALVDFVGLIKKGLWPAKPALSLDLAIEEPAPEAKQAEQLASVTAANALKTFNFTQAVNTIKSMPDYHTLENAVQAIPYSAEQIRTSLTDLLNKEASYANQRQKWLDKVQLLGLAGRQKELYEALNSSCDIEYLRTHNQQTDWYVKIVDTRQDMYGNAQKAPFEQLLSPVYLHRFCYQELVSHLNPQYAQKSSRSELQTLADNYISQAPVALYKAVARDSEPARLMSEENWLPSWASYKQSREMAFSQQEALASENLRVQKNKDEQDRIIAERQKHMMAAIKNLNREYQKRLDEAEFQQWWRTNSTNLDLSSKYFRAFGDYSSAKINAMAKPSWTGIELMELATNGGPMSKFVNCAYLGEHLPAFINNPSSLEASEFIILNSKFAQCLKLSKAARDFTDWTPKQLIASQEMVDFVTYKLNGSNRISDRQRRPKIYPLDSQTNTRRNTSLVDFETEGTSLLWKNINELTGFNLAQSQAKAEAEYALARNAQTQSDQENRDQKAQQEAERLFKQRQLQNQFSSGNANDSQDIETKVPGMPDRPFRFDRKERNKIQMSLLTFSGNKLYGSQISSIFDGSSQCQRVLSNTKSPVDNGFIDALADCSALLQKDRNAKNIYVFALNYAQAFAAR
jgi:hypothetical protein